MKHLATLLVLATFVCSCSEKLSREDQLNKLATEYVRTGLLIGLYDPDFVDAYYGPDSLKPEKISPSDTFPKAALLEKTGTLKLALRDFIDSSPDSSLVHRARYIMAQLKAAETRIRIVAGEHMHFDDESEQLFGLQAPTYDSTHFQHIIAQLDSILPGTGSLQMRYQSLSDRFVIPAPKLERVFKAAIAKAREETKKHYPIPEKESFKLEFVTDKSWSGYNWYKGNYTSLIQINTDFPINISRVLDVGSHESYPGHHVYNMLLEENLYRKKKYIETSLYPLFSPQSFIAEGSANFGIELVFPLEEKIRFSKETLLPMAGLDTNGIAAYFKATELTTQLNYAGNEVARALLAGQTTEKQAIDYLIKYGFYSDDKAKQRIGFIQKYRSYVINYNFGKDLVKNYIESRGGTPENKDKRWQLFGELLSNQILPIELTATN